MYHYYPKPEELKKNIQHAAIGAACAQTIAARGPGGVMGAFNDSAIETRPIVNDMGRVTAARDRLHERIDMLSNRLAMVLAAEQTGYADPAPAPSGARSPMGESLDGMAMSIFAACDRIDALLSRLEL